MKQHLLLALAVLAAVVAYRAAVAAGPPRAKPPVFSDDVVDTFFPDARKVLKGERPVFAGAKNIAKTGGPMAGQAAEEPAGEGFAWSKLISAATIEDEIKTQKMAIDKTVDTPGAFKGGGYQDARIEFSVLAAMFHVAGQYDKNVRWKEEAPGLRDLFARAGFNCKVGTDQSYKEASLRKQDLGDLIRGGTISAAEQGQADVTWDKVTDRPPLMNRFRMANDRLGPWLASKKEFSAHAEEILHEAEVLAAMAEAIQHEGFEFWEDEDYVGYAAGMRDAAVKVAQGVKQNNYEAASAAAGELSQACGTCHDSYR